tara:strand:- start:78 stop:602 length:525 start_codon:yes stop_codon:yes gene_type:complete
MVPVDKLRKANIQRFDIIVNMLFIDWYYKKNDCGYRLYELSKQHGPSKFIRLIKSFENAGFNRKFLPVTEDYYLNGDGAHRLSCCLYFDLKNVPAEVDQKKYKYVNHYGLKWLKSNYSDCDIEKIVNFYCKIHFNNLQKIKNKIFNLIKSNYDDTQIENVDKYLELLFDINNVN